MSSNDNAESRELKRRPVISQRMSLHLNYGSEGHGYHYDIFADDKPTQIIRATRSKHGKRIADRLICGDEKFDLMGATGAAAIDWILERIAAQAVTVREG